MKKNSYYLLFCLSIKVSSSFSIPIINPNENALTKIHKIANPNTPLRLHLGCGENRLDGYVNIDFPPSEHTTQTYTAANIFADLTRLKFPSNSINEIRSHHVFEHFDRNIAIALLCSWFEGLKIGGTLVIETPDFDTSIRIIANPSYNYREKQVTLRHIFGSHEAYWAMHYDGWYKEKFEHILSILGFSDIECKLITHPGYELVPNIVVKARKTQNLSRNELHQRAKSILRESLVNNTETMMYSVWCNNFEKAIKHLTLK